MDKTTNRPDKSKALFGQTTIESGMSQKLQTLAKIMGFDACLPGGVNTSVSIQDERIPALQQPPTPEEQEELEFQQLVEELHDKYRVSIAKPFPPEVCTLEIDGVGFFAEGDIHAIKAKQKAGKTHTVVTYAAAALSGQWGRLKGLVTDARVLIIDTEQKPADTQAIYQKVLEMAGMPLEDNFDRLEVYTLRKRTIAERIKDVEALIKSCKSNIVFLDGIVDLSHNFNDVKDSETLIDGLMKLATEYNCAIVNTLHTNKALEDDNMRGHLGTMLAQKSGNVIECRKSKGGIVTVRSADERHAPVPSWSFRFNSDGAIINADEEKRLADIEKAQQQAEKRALDKRLKLEENLKFFKQVFAKNSSTMDVVDLKKLYAQEKGVTPSTARNHYNQLIEAGELVEDLDMVRLAGEKERQQKFRD